MSLPLEYKTEALIGSLERAVPMFRKIEFRFGSVCKL